MPTKKQAREQTDSVRNERRLAMIQWFKHRVFSDEAIDAVGREFIEEFKEEPSMNTILMAWFSLLNDHIMQAFERVRMEQPEQLQSYATFIDNNLQAILYMWYEVKNNAIDNNSSVSDPRSDEPEPETDLSSVGGSESEESGEEASTVE